MTAQKYTYRSLVHELIEVAVSASGNLYCPVCGFEFDTLGYDLGIFLRGGTEICPCCSTHFGCNDIPQNLGSVPVDWSTERAWEGLRAKWLERECFSESAVKQVQNHLGLVVEVPELGTPGNTGVWICRYREEYRKGVPLGEWNKCMLNRETQEFLIKSATGPQSGFIQASGRYRDIRFGQTLRMMESRPDRYFIDPPDEIVWR